MQSRSRILVIDDDPMFRSLLVSLLRKDYLVSVAADGESGFAKAREHRPDLVIIDHQMPGWNGVKTLKCTNHSFESRSCRMMSERSIFSFQHRSVAKRDRTNEDGMKKVGVFS